MVTSNVLTLEKLVALVRESEADPINQAIGGTGYVFCPPTWPKGKFAVIGSKGVALYEPDGTARVIPFGIEVPKR